MNLFKRAADIFAKHDVPIENEDLPEGVMSESDYDADGAVKEAGGIADYVAEHGSGLPDPSSYDDGTVLIKVGNEWKAQSGYGYEEETGAVHTIDPKFIPQSGDEFVVNFSMNGDTVIADKTPAEVTQADSLGKHCVGVFDAKHFTFGGGIFQLITFADGDLLVSAFTALDTENWEFAEFYYTLTPSE